MKIRNRNTGDIHTLTEEQAERFFDNRNPSDFQNVTTQGDSAAPVHSLLQMGSRTYPVQPGNAAHSSPTDPGHVPGTLGTDWIERELERGEKHGKR